MQRFHAVICMLNSKYIHSSLAPWYLLAGIDAYCHKSISAEVVEGTVNMPLQEIADKLIAKSPQVIGFCCYIWNIAFIKKLLPVIKQALPDTVIILGGPEVSFNARDVLTDEPLVDYVISGEGERPIAQLLSALNIGADVGGIPGICCRNEENVVVAPPHYSLDDPPNPYTNAYFKALNGRIAYLETSRGCPFSCAFCLSGRIGGIRFFDLERSKRDLLLLATSGTQTVKLVDRTFNANRSRARELFAFIIENYGGAVPEGIRFHFEIAGDLMDEETFVLLKTAPAGVFQFEIGLQSFNAVTLEAIDRKTDVTKLQYNIDRLIALGTIHIHIDLIAGLPYENFKSFADGFNTAYKLKPHMLQLGFLKLLHGAAMREQPALYPCRYSADPPYEVTETPWLTGQELQQLHDTEDALERIFNSGRFRRTLGYVLEQTGLTPFYLFLYAGRHIANKMNNKSSLDYFTEILYEFFGTINGLNKMTLRDKMSCDRLATNSTGRLPKCLQIADKELRNAVILLNRQESKPVKKGLKRGYALLKTENTLVYADYNVCDPVTGEFPLQQLPLK